MFFLFFNVLRHYHIRCTGVIWADSRARLSSDGAAECSLWCTGVAHFHPRAPNGRSRHWNVTQERLTEKHSERLTEKHPERLTAKHSAEADRQVRSRSRHRNETQKRQTKKYAGEADSEGGREKRLGEAIGIRKRKHAKYNTWDYTLACEIVCEVFTLSSYVKRTCCHYSAALRRSAFSAITSWSSTSWMAPSMKTGRLYMV